jgi:hypothetical protein
MVLDFVTPNSPTGTRHQPDPMDPLVAEQARQARAKHGQAPHLLIAVRAFATGPTIGAARAAAADITSGYTLLSPHWRPRRLWRPATAADARWVPERHMHLATVAEAAALAGLPAEPSSYGLPAAPSRRIPPSRDTFTPPGHAAGRSRRLGPGSAQRRESPETGDDNSLDDVAADAAEDGADDDSSNPPTVWSTP